MIRTSTKEEIFNILSQESVKRWGKERGEMLRRTLELVADELWKVCQYSLHSEEEPAFFLQYVRQPAGEDT